MSQYQKNNLKACIRTLAHKHGFDLCHFSRPNVSEKDKQALQSWVQSDKHGDMAWMAESERLERRKTPQSMLNGVKTVISVAMRHAEPAYSLEKAISSQKQGIIASYAHGVDYHDVMKKRLKAFARDLDALIGEHGQRVYVDTAPVLEHALAAASGLGWQGKHTLTIHKKQGSWMLLGEIFTTAEIETDQPASNHCGTCTACIDICPTHAIIAPYIVDANLCISYLTIEYKGFIPHALRPLMGNHIYGCDDCQMVCPWNSKAEKVKHDFLAMNKENILPELVSLLHLDDASFRERFKKSPIKRTGKAALARNICIAMGNSGDTSFRKPLLACLNDESALVRGHAVWALGELQKQITNHEESIRHAIEALQKIEQNSDVLKEIDAVLA